MGEKRNGQIGRMTYKTAKRLALRAYREAVKAGERGDWKEAKGLTDSNTCAFCRVEGWCRQCVARKICSRNYPTKTPNGDAFPSPPFGIAWRALHGFITPESALAALRQVVQDLEKLEV